MTNFSSLSFPSSSVSDGTAQLFCTTIKNFDPSQNWSGDAISSAGVLEVALTVEISLRFSLYDQDAILHAPNVLHLGVFVDEEILPPERSLPLNSLGYKDFGALIVVLLATEPAYDATESY